MGFKSLKSEKDSVSRKDAAGELNVLQRGKAPRKSNVDEYSNPFRKRAEFGLSSGSDELKPEDREREHLLSFLFAANVALVERTRFQKPTMSLIQTCPFSRRREH